MESFPLSGPATSTAGPTPRFVGDLWWCTTTANGFTANTLYEHNGTSWNSVAAIRAVLGPTFATSTVSITPVDTWVTAVTLGSPLAAGGSYLVKAGTRLSVSAGDLCSARLLDVTNNVEIRSTSAIAPSGVAPFDFSIEYYGYAGTPSLALQVLDHTANAGNTTVTAQGGVANKQTFISALPYA